MDTNGTTAPQTAQDGATRANDGSGGNPEMAKATALAGALWAALTAIAETAPDGSRAISTPAALTAFSMVAARLVDGACAGGPVEHYHQLYGALMSDTGAMIAKHRAVREALRPTVAAAPRARIALQS